VSAAAGGSSSLAMLDQDSRWRRERRTDGHDAVGRVRRQPPFPILCLSASADWLPCHVSQLPVHSSPRCSRALWSSLVARSSLSSPSHFQHPQSLHRCTLAPLLHLFAPQLIRPFALRDDRFRLRSPSRHLARICTCSTQLPSMTDTQIQEGDKGMSVTMSDSRPWCWCTVASRTEPDIRANKREHGASGSCTRM
jgi:hypothetical protein